MIEEKGPWSAAFSNDKAFIESDDFTHDVRLYVSGDFESIKQRVEYAEEIARRLNTFASSQAEETITACFRMTRSERDKLAILGGAKWIRAKIKAAIVQPSINTTLPLQRYSHEVKRRVANTIQRIRNVADQLEDET